MPVNTGFSIRNSAWVLTPADREWVQKSNSILFLTMSDIYTGFEDQLQHDPRNILFHRFIE